MATIEAARFLINASNLHHGGGVQVAVSFLAEVALLKNTLPGLAAIHVLVSETVDHSLRSVGTDVSCFASYRVHNSVGFRGYWVNKNTLFSGYDAVFTVFGPLYTWVKPSKSLIGFANPLIIYPHNEVFQKLPFRQRILQRMVSNVQGWLFAREDRFIVELEHVRDALVQRGLAKQSQVNVIHNALSSIYQQPERWQALEIPDVDTDILLGYLGRNYPHKNTDLFPQVSRSLAERHRLRAKFLVTFTVNEWQACSEEFRACAVNVGPLTVAQCPRFYEALDGVFFPSLLECFSVTPLEAMAMQRPLFASNRAFIKDICGQHAHYFEPLDADGAADCLAAYFRSVAPREATLLAAREHALTFSNPARRAAQYLQSLYELAAIPVPVGLVNAGAA